MGGLDITSKNKKNRRKIGKTKAKKEITMLIKGSTITSSTKMSYDETVTQNNGEVKVDSKETYQELIIEDVNGFLDGIIDIGGWYSDDKLAWYHAVIRMIPKKKSNKNEIECPHCGKRFKVK